MSSIQPLVLPLTPPARRPLPRRVLGLYTPIWANRRLIWQLALQELRLRYAGTLVGSIWAFIHPVVLIVAFWFVSTRGLKITFETGPPYFLFLFCGMVPWMMFSDAASTATGAVLSHKYLVSKIKFPLEILPVVSVVAAFVVHLVLLTLLIAILRISGSPLTLHVVQLPVFLVGMLAFSTGLAWVLSALNVFQRDVGQTFTAILTIWFWMTPILWPATGMSRWALRILKLNPMYYVVEGYRDALLYGRPLGMAWKVDVYFWSVTVFLVLAGAVMFRRLKPHFADVM